MFLFYIIGVAGDRTKTPPPRSPGQTSGENYVLLQWAQSWGRIFPGRSQKDSGLGHGGQADLVVAPVKHCEVLADEDVAQDPEVSGGGGEFHGLEATDTVLLHLEKRRMKLEMGHSLRRDRLWGTEPQGPRPAARHVHRGVSWLVSGDVALLAWALPAEAVPCTVSFQGLRDIAQCFWQVHKP